LSPYLHREAVIILKNILFITAGSVCVGLGILGAFIPVLPTTPFLLLASYLYLKSSKRLHNWLIGHRLFGSYIYNYITYRAVRRRVKIGAVIFLWVTLAISIFLVNNIYIRILLIFVGISVSIHILTLKTLEDIQRSSKWNTGCTVSTQKEKKDRHDS
jgi:uncharacterized membrane protein YbaN (DUF454 family)